MSQKKHWVEQVEIKSTMKKSSACTVDGYAAEAVLLKLSVIKECDIQMEEKWMNLSTNTIRYKVACPQLKS